MRPIRQAQGLFVVLLLAWIGLGMLGCGEDKAAEPARKPIKVGFLYLNTVGDVGWTYSTSRDAGL